MASTFPDLTAPRDVTIKSDDTVEARVTKRMSEHVKAASKAKKTLAPAKPVSTIGETWPKQLAPQDILHVLGEALTPVLPRGAFELSRQWARFRYFWAFDQGSALRLSQEADALVDHHRTLSAEHLGIGIALHVAEWLIRKRHAGQSVDVQWVDADVALGRGALDLGGTRRVATAAGAPRRMRPDYFFTVMDRASRNVVVYAIEAKGTHTPGHWVEQMAKGARQVAAARVNNMPPTGFIFSAELGAERIVIRALDPAGDESWTGPAVRREDKQIAHEDADQCITVIDEPDAFRHRLIRAADATLLSFAGQHESAAAALGSPRDAEPRAGLVGDEPLEEAETPVGKVAFTTLTFPLGAEELYVRTGAAAEVLSAARSEDADARPQAAANLETRLSNERGTDDTGHISWLSTEGDGRVVESMRPNGSYVRAEIKRRGRRG